MATCKAVEAGQPAELLLRLTADEARVVRERMNQPLNIQTCAIDEALRAAGVRL